MLIPTVIILINYEIYFFGTLNVIFYFRIIIKVIIIIIDYRFMFQFFSFKSIKNETSLNNINNKNSLFDN